MLIESYAWIGSRYEKVKYLFPTIAPSYSTQNWYFLKLSEAFSGITENKTKQQQKSTPRLVFTHLNAFVMLIHNVPQKIGNLQISGEKIQVEQVVCSTAHQYLQDVLLAIE